MQVPSPNETQNGSPFKGFLPFFWLALVCMGGILLADKVKLPAWVWGAGAGLCTLIWILTHVLPKSLTLSHRLKKWTRSEYRLPGAILAAVFFVGGWRYTAAQPVVTPGHVAFYNDRGTVQVIGRIIQPPDNRDNQTNLTLQVESLLLVDDSWMQVSSEEVMGIILLQVKPGNEWAYGDRLGVTGQLQTPFESVDFSYREYLARKGILSLMPYARVDWIERDQGNPIKAFLVNLQTRGYETVQMLFPSPESDLLAGILLGHDQGLSPDLQAAFRRTGTTHIIAISGFNIAILAGLFSGISTRLLGHKWGAVTTIGAITGYTILVGGDAAVVRAAIMGALGVWGGIFGRRQNGLNSLGLAGLGMVLINPNIPWDLGFQLSVTATLGLVLYAQPLEERFIKFATRWTSEERAQMLVGPVSEFFLFSLAAQVMTLPIVAYHFGGVSWLAMIANPLILPPQSLVMILGGVTLLTGMALPGLGQVMAMITLPFVSYTIRMVTWLAHLPGGDLVLPDFHPLWLIVFYALLFVFTLLPREQRSNLLGKVVSHQTATLILTGLVIFVWNRVLTIPDGNLHLTLLDSEGTVLLQTPGGNTVLVGGGSSPSHLNQVLGQMLPPHDYALNLLIVGSPTRDDLNGLTGVLKRIPVEMVLWGIDLEANQTTATVHALLVENGASRQSMQAGQSIDLGDGIILSVLRVGERGSVLWLEWGNFSALLPTGKAEDRWLEVPESPDVLLLKDGLNAKNLPLWQINLWSPTVILLPLEESEMPLQGEHELVRLLAGYPVVDTLDQGWVRVSTDGKQIWVESEW